MAVYKKIIEKELDYPRVVLYSIPAQLPAANASARKNDEYMKAAKALEKKGEIRFERKDIKTLLIPRENNQDVIQAVQDMQYKTIALNVVLGVLSAEFTSYKKQGALVVVEGKSKFKPSRIYNELSKVIPPDVSGDCVSKTLIWEINMAESGRKSIEKTK
ncbi:hypothetical protein [Candidatus Magnetomonas plexicatena]|uniref:hypothetical protein n=1 Tax=Candidatus Magnetomonas plexicatena TaxID=2552947 RepID=UPI001C755474|nr:hypothetical protein E2O03_000860 [Nitrospirales bacterium LBB_01]